MKPSIFFEALGKRSLCFLISVFCLLIFTVNGIAQDTPELTTVQGLGYPPIRAENAAQAYLMAKRAAVVDAYRNSLAGKTPQGQGSDIQYQELSGFVSGMTIVKEEYLKDGGVRITAKVPDNIIPRSAGSEMRRTDTRRGPQSVTLDEWYSIINNLVRFEKNK